MENISCMRVKYLGEFLTEIGDTYTDKNGKIPHQPIRKKQALHPSAV